MAAADRQRQANRKCRITDRQLCHRRFAKPIGSDGVCTDRDQRLPEASESFGFSGFATGRFLWRLFIGILCAESVAIEAAIFREDRFLRRFGIAHGCQQSFELFDLLGEFLILVL